MSVLSKPTNDQLIYAFTIASLSSVLISEILWKIKKKNGKYTLQELANFDIWRFFFRACSFSSTVTALQVYFQFNKLSTTMIYMWGPALSVYSLDFKRNRKERFLQEKNEMEKEENVFKNCFNFVKKLFNNSSSLLGICLIQIFPIITPFIGLMIPGVTFSPTSEYWIKQLDQGIESIKQLDSSQVQVTATTQHQLTQLESLKQNFQEQHYLNFYLKTILQANLFGLTINTFFAFGEEKGWRDFLLKRLDYLSVKNKNSNKRGEKKVKEEDDEEEEEEMSNFWKKSFFIGLLHELWHIPVILNGHNYGYDHGQLGCLMMTGFTILLSPIYCYFTKRSKELNPAIYAGMMHGCMNALGAVGHLFVGNNFNPFINGVVGLSGFLTLGLLNLSIYCKQLRDYNRKQKSTTNTHLP
ncbi:hypothetical protein ABK040_010587 [Willaertia magna]